MKASRNWLKTFFDTDIPTGTELAEAFTFHSFEVEGVEKINDDDVIDVKILPDRAHYCLSHKGIAEEIHIITGIPLKQNRNPQKNKNTAIVNNPDIRVPSVTILTSPQELDSHGLFCRRYMCRRIENLTLFDKKNSWMETYLETIGERSINTVVDAANIVMFDTGQPLHVFDADKVVGGIVVRAARAGEKITLLDGKEVALAPHDHVVADDEGPLAIAGVKGGKRAEVTTATRNLLIESANFNPTAVRRTATRLHLRNESSKRFENEITPELASEGMDMISALIAEFAPGAATQMSAVVDVYPARPTPTVIVTTLRYVNDRLGIEVPEKDFNTIIDRLGIQKQISGEEITLTIPYHRLDLTVPEDIVEEIGRIYGYEKITTHLPAPATPPTTLPIFYLVEKIKNILIVQGFSEVALYTLVAKGEVETAYPLANDKSFARANLTDGMAACLEKNIPNADLLGLDTISIFEIGHVFAASNESTMLSLGVAQIKKIKGMKSDTVLTATLASLSNALGLSVPITPENLMTKGNYSICQINLETLLSVYAIPKNASYTDLKFHSASSTVYKKFSPYPFIVRDIAVFTPEDITAETVWSAVEDGVADAHAGQLIARHALFDTFKKEGKISYAFRLVFQSYQKTLTDEEANAVMEQIYLKIRAHGWEVR